MWLLFPVIRVGSANTDLTRSKILMTGRLSRRATNFRCAVPFDSCTPCDDPHTVWQLSLVSVVSAGCCHASMRATVAPLMCPGWRSRTHVALSWLRFAFEFGVFTCGSSLVGAKWTLADTGLSHPRWFADPPPGSDRPINC